MKISVIIPVYNSELFLKECVESALDQTLKPDEIILIDDASKDNSREMIKVLESGHPEIVRSIFLTENKGPAAARNAGMRSAVGELIAFLDSDDFWKPEKLERQVRFLKQENLDVCYSDYVILNESGDMVDQNCPRQVDFDSMLLQNHIGTSTVLLRRSSLKGAEFPNLLRRQDWAMWLLLLKSGFKMGGLPEKLTVYRARKDSVSRVGVRLERKLSMLIKYRWLVYQSIGIGAMRRLWLITRFVMDAYAEKFKKAMNR